MPDIDIKCTKHKNISASWECDKCHKWFCDMCMEHRENISPNHRRCPECTGICENIFGQESRSFFSYLIDSLVYPLRGKGPYILIIGSAFFGFLKFSGIVPFFGWIASAFGTCYLSAYIFDIVQTSASGRKELPDWPDLADILGDLVKPFLLIVGTVLICFGPAAAYVLFTEAGKASYSLFLALFFAGLLYFPMSLLATAMGIPLVFNPYIIFKSIGRVILHYIVVLLFLGFVIFMGHTARITLTAWLGLLGYMISGVISFYATIVEMRILGLLYFVDEQTLNWFKRN